MFTMYDSVTEDVIPKEPHAVAAYINGQYANFEKCRKMFPHARILTISVNGLDVIADAYDIEKGDYQPDETARLYQTAKAHGIWRPCFYAQLDGTMPAVKADLNKIVGLQRADVRLWVAYYNGQPDLPPGYDAHQFTDRALGRNLDESICADTFFRAAKPEIKKPAEPWRAEITVNTDDGEWSVKGLPASGG